MKKKIIIAAGIAIALVGLACIVFLWDTSPPPGPEPEKRIQAEKAVQSKEIPREAIAVSKPAKKATVQAEKVRKQEPVEYVPEEDLIEPEEEEPYHPKTTEEIKQQIYDLGIEYVEDIELLDEVVQTGDADTRDLWSAHWLSVDDWKEGDNGFRLEPQEDGTYKFFPDEETSRTYTFFETPKTYTYDEVNKEFYWETDYYGKTITHKARFINENVLVTMLISGRKVVLDIYEKYPEAEKYAE